MAGEESRHVNELPGGSRMTPQHYRSLRRKTVVRLSLLYLIPVVVLAIYFVLQYDAVVSEGQRLHLKALAESQANTLELFLSERRVNLSNVVDDPGFGRPPTSRDLENNLAGLRKVSDAFVDIGFFDSSGVQIAYAGPYPSLESRSYRDEDWYASLIDQSATYIITDIYLGFRNKPHFTIALKRATGQGLVVLRATLDPERIYRYIGSIDGASDVLTCIVNRAGQYQLVASSIGSPLDTSVFLPPREPSRGAAEFRIQGLGMTCGYAWLHLVDWALVVQETPERGGTLFSGFRLRVAGVAAAMILLGFIVIVFRARKRVELQLESDTSRAQLEHAAKLASVGELAAGIAHEINNPLAAINEEAGLLKDLMDPAMGRKLEPDDLKKYLDSIQESVFRCRDITRKLLGFVRQTDTDLKEHDIHELLDRVIDGILGHEMTVSNIEVVRKYDEDIPPLVTDSNQLQQVFLNILNNAIDALEDNPGTITVITEQHDDKVAISLADTGQGMSPHQMENIFVPFYTTKEVGKGTGLGLSVSYGIVKNLGGRIEVTSNPGRGTTFTIIFPVSYRAGNRERVLDRHAE